MKKPRLALGTRFPVLCAAMNQVSDANLAIAVSQAGGFPSLSLANYINQDLIDKNLFISELKKFKNEAQSDKLMLSIGGIGLLNSFVVDTFLDYGFRHFELFHWFCKDPAWPKIVERSLYLKETYGAEFYYKVSTGDLDQKINYENIIIKGSEGAGRHSEKIVSTEEGARFCFENLKSSRLIVSGGIYSSEQVKSYLDQGACGIAVGTLFAASKESSVNIEVKKKIIAAEKESLKRLGKNNLRGLYQTLIPDDNKNFTRTLSLGVQDPNQGGIFLGDAVSSIYEIRTVEEIIKTLFKCIAE